MALSSVSFIGSGMMASALMGSMISKKVVPGPEAISCSAVRDISLKAASDKGYFSSKSNVEICKRAKDAIIIGVKPNIIPVVSKDIDSAFVAVAADKQPLIISIAAGVTLESLEEYLPGHRVVRVMPNTPCLVGEAASAFALGKLATKEDREIVELIFGSVGLVKELKEDLLNAATGVAGSGPAYVFQLIEALADGGVRCGLPRDVAMDLAAQTVKGAAELVLQSGKHPGLLKDGVTSPGGTTIAGVEALENSGFRSATISAVKAASRRSMQLGGISEEEIKHKYNL